ncbi:MAG: hypothetical protein IKT39_03405 [Clostridia bacterium]|nr:hypothetical protein [Clostridia bacterium]
MDDIRIYDTDFNLLHIENDVVSSNWTINFNSVGTFEIHTLADTQTAQIIARNFDFIQNKIPVILQGDLQGIVTGIRLSDDFAIYGKTCNWLLSRKIVPKFISSDLPVSCNPEEIARYIVSNAFSDQDNFILGEYVGLEDIDSFWRNTYNPVSDVVSDLLAKKNAGHDVKFDRINKRWIFNIYPPAYPEMILSGANGNASGMEYTYSIDNYFSECWYEQEQQFVDGEFPDPVWTKFVKDEKTGIFRNECTINATVESEVQSLIKEKTVKSEIVTDVLGEDFRPGDILRVQFLNGKIARTVKKQVSGVQLGWENGKKTRQLILKDI